MTDVTPEQPTAAAPADLAEPVPVTVSKAPASPDTRRLVIALVVLGLVAVTAVGFGIVRKKSTSDAATTATTAAPAGGPTTTAAGAGGPSTTAAGGGTTQCPNWTKSLYSKPTSLKEAGVYLYNDNKFHLRVVSKDAVDYTGMITAANNLDAKNFKLTAPAAGTLEVKGNTATFTIHAAEAGPGLDFSIPCQSSQFSVAVNNADGQPVAIDKFVIGKDGKAISNPLIFNR